MRILVAGYVGLKPDSGIWPLAAVNFGGIGKTAVLLEWRSILKNVMLPLEIVPNDFTMRRALSRA